MTCKSIEITQNTQILKIADFAILYGLPTSEITKKKPQKKVTKSLFGLKFNQQGLIDLESMLIPFQT